MGGAGGTTRPTHPARTGIDRGQRVANKRAPGRELGQLELERHCKPQYELGWLVHVQYHDRDLTGVLCHPIRDLHADLQLRVALVVQQHVVQHHQSRLQSPHARRRKRARKVADDAPRQARPRVLVGGVEELVDHRPNRRVLRHRHPLPCYENRRIVGVQDEDDELRSGGQGRMCGIRRNHLSRRRSWVGEGKGGGGIGIRASAPMPCGDAPSHSRRTTARSSAANRP